MAAPKKSSFEKKLDPMKRLLIQPLKPAQPIKIDPTEFKAIPKAKYLGPKDQSQVSKAKPVPNPNGSSEPIINKKKKK